MGCRAGTEPMDCSYYNFGFLFGLRLHHGQYFHDLIDHPDFFPGHIGIRLWLFDLITMQHQAALHAQSAIPPPEITPDLKAQIEIALAHGLELSREMQRALGIRVTEGIVNRISLEQTAIWFGILVLIVVEVRLNYAAGRPKPFCHQCYGSRHANGGNL